MNIFHHCSLFVISCSLVFPHFIPHTLLIHTAFHHLFISIECRGSTFDFQKYYFIQIPFGKSIENNVINSFSEKHEILVMIRKIRQKWSYFFMHMPKNNITRSRHRITSLFFYFNQKIQFRNKIPNNQSDNNSYDNQSKIRIHDIIIKI